ncbi:MAG: RagB/SusD family nutrient uptake outer membrane protein, partial [bacterium]
TKHASAVWDLLNPKGSTPDNPWVSAGKSDAEAALALMGDDSYKWQFFYAPGAEWNDFSWQVNGRLELDIAALPSDPIDGTVDPRMAAIDADFRDTGKYNGTNYAPLTIVSATEMRLIIAEAELAGGSAGAAITHMNALRTASGLTAITNEDAATMLKWERRANLFLQGRRLADMYRYGEKDPMWQSTSDAFTTPGSFLPITIGELQSNPLISR